MRIDTDSFAVKAAGSSLSTLDPSGVTRCRQSTVLALFERPNATDEDVERALLDSRLDGSARKPSTAALFHAYLLSLPEINFVGHTHPRHASALLCSPHAENFAFKRLFPDEIVCCGAVSVSVPYVNPGVPLAREIRDRVEAFRAHYERLPRLILLANHGIIALGATPQAVLATTLMTEKAAAIHSHAALGGSTF